MAIDYNKIKTIHKDSVRIITNAGVVPDNSSFLYEDNNRPVKQGTSYHIHYTSDFKEHYMTGKKHFYASRIIKPTFFTGHSDYTKYTKLAGSSYQPLSAEIVKGVPKKSDYGAGVFTRYFAKNINDEETQTYDKSLIEYRCDGQTVVYGSTVDKDSGQLVERYWDRTIAPAPAPKNLQEIGYQLLIIDV